MGMTNVCYPRLPDGSSKHESWMIDAIQYIDGYSADNLVDNPEADAEIENVVSLERAIAESQGQGFARTPQERKAIEDCAMKSAKKYFKGLDFTVEDVSARRSYDLVCSRPNLEIHVEVKGSTTDGKAIVLTNNEVKHALDEKFTCALFILHSIKLNKGKASGGTKVIWNPWQIEKVRLKP